MDLYGLNQAKLRIRLKEIIVMCTGPGRKVYKKRDIGKQIQMF